MSVPQRSSAAAAASGQTPPPSPESGPSGAAGLIQKARPYLWVPSLYLAMGIPFNVIMGGTAARMYKSLGYTDSQITVPLGFMGMAWSLKPFWAAFLDMYRTKKFFVLTMEIVLAALMGAVALSLPIASFYKVSIAVLWVAAFASSTQDICGDGIYLTALNKSNQAKYAGIQGMFWTLGKVLATGIVITVMDHVRQTNGWSYPHMWTAVFFFVAAILGLLAVYHFFVLPAGSIEDRPSTVGAVVRDFLGTAESFFHKRAFWGMIAFVFLYRIGEGLILLEGQLFLQSSTVQGGLGLTAGQVSEIDAIYGTIAFVVGTTLGGVFIGKVGLKTCLGILGLSLNVPHFTYVALSQLGASGHGVSYSTIVTLVSIEKFGYGFGFVGNMVYMMQQIAPGRATMTHYAFATALMNLMLVPTNMISGPLAEWLGFSTFFLVVMFASVPSVWAAFKAPFPREADHPEGSVPDETAAHITADDPTRVAGPQQRVQKLAGYASIFAMANIIVLLAIDAPVLGSLQGKAVGTGKVQFAILLALAIVKLGLAISCFNFAAKAAEASAAGGDGTYVRNARGAKITTVLCGLATLLVLAFGARMAF